METSCSVKAKNSIPKTVQVGERKNYLSRATGKSKTRRVKTQPLTNSNFLVA